jgi:hypothetical protein
MDQEDKNKIRREKLIKYIRANNPLFLFASFDSYSLERLEKLKADIDEGIKSERNRKFTIHLN